MYTPIYWIVTTLPGRIGITPRPRGNDWIDDEVQAWHRSGIQIVVSLLTPPEEIELGLTYESKACQSNDIEYISLPIPDRQTPSPNRNLFIVLEELAQYLYEGKQIIIHCRMGIGRASLVAASVLTLCGMTADDAFTLIEQARGCPVPDTPAQREWVKRFAATK